jgi:hypothetical protein
MLLYGGFGRRLERRRGYGGRYQSNVIKNNIKLLHFFVSLHKAYNNTRPPTKESKQGKTEQRILEREKQHYNNKHTREHSTRIDTHTHVERQGNKNQKHTTRREHESK